MQSGSQLGRGDRRFTVRFSECVEFDFDRVASGELDDDTHVATDGMQVRREGRDEQVAALLDLRDVALRHVKPTREFHLRQAKRVAQRSQPHRVFAIRFRKGCAR